MRRDAAGRFVREHRRAPGGFDRRSFRTVRAGQHRVITACPRGSFRRGRCRTATRAVSVLHPNPRVKRYVAYQAIVTAAPGHLLLGGVRETRSTPFETRAMAQRFVDQSVTVNRDAGRPASGRVVLTATRTPPISRAEVGENAKRRRKRRPFRFRCTGRSAGRTVRCAFRTDSEAAAHRHFEQHDHDVDDTRRVKDNPAGSTLIYPEGRLVGTWYGRHRNGGHYKHRFSHQHASIHGLPDGSLVIKARRGRLWAMFSR